MVHLIFDAIVVGLVEGVQRAGGDIEVLGRLVVDEERIAGEGVAGERRQRTGRAVQLQVSAVVGAADEVIAGDAGGAAVDQPDADGVVVDMVVVDRGRTGIDVDADGVAGDRIVVVGDVRRGLRAGDQNARRAPGHVRVVGNGQTN